jgi:myo-inositol-1(or 4)-monophosphatase
MEIADGLACARESAAQAVAVHRRHAGLVAAEAWTEKAAADFVTYVDREAERCIVDAIRSRFPDHAILAEEAATGPAGAAVRAEGWLWVVDPLDGTTNFLHGYPMYGVSIAALLNGVLQLGVVQDSVSGDVWHATRHGGAYRNGAPIHVSSQDRPGRALIGTGFPFKARELLPQYLVQLDCVLRNTAGVRRAGSAALDLCHVATGWFDGFWELSLQPWDIAAGALIVREAGGIITTMDGSDDVVAAGSVLAGNPAMHTALARILKVEQGTD